MYRLKDMYRQNEKLSFKSVSTKWHIFPKKLSKNMETSIRLKIYHHNDNKRIQNKGLKLEKKSFFFQKNFDPKIFGVYTINLFTNVIFAMV